MTSLCPDLAAVFRALSLAQDQPHRWHDRLYLPLTIACHRYYAGWADKVQGKTIAIAGDYFCYTSGNING
jgi:aldehyde dehydrogenase (NAD+)